MFVFSVSAWFPGGATPFQPCISWPRPLSEPCLRYLRTRLLTWSFREESMSILPYAAQFSCHRFPASVNGRCFLTPRYHVWPPSLQRHYPPSPVLLGHPTPCAPFAFLPLRLSGILPLREENAGPPGLPCNHYVRHAMVSDPEEANISLPVSLMLVLTSVISNCVVLPIASLTGLFPFNLAAYGLSACCPTLKVVCYHTTSKDSLPGGWPTFRGGIRTR